MARPLGHQEGRVRSGQTFALRETTQGWIGVAASPRGLRRVLLPVPSREQALYELGVGREDPEDGALQDFLARLERYLEGDITATLMDVWDDRLGTPFQQAVWRAAQAIPMGQTRTYQEVACTIGRPRAARAVGQALGANPLPVLIPCHRVIRGDGSLGGFAQGLELKRRLLILERATLPL
jgi:O-6-methylguanine DNA methyltransferase